MTSFRDSVAELLDGMIDFGSIEATEGGNSATIRGYDDGAGGVEELGGCEVWGLAAVQYRPAAGTEVLILRRGDEIVGLATKDRRISVELAEGEAVVTNLSGDTPARVRLRADGEVWIEASTVRFMDAGDDAATAEKALAVAQEVEQALEKLDRAIQSWTPTPNDGGAALQVALTAEGIGAGLWPPPLGSGRVHTKN